MSVRAERLQASPADFRLGTLVNPNGVSNHHREMVTGLLGFAPKMVEAELERKGDLIGNLNDRMAVDRAIWF